MMGHMMEMLRNITFLLVELQLFSASTKSTRSTTSCWQYIIHCMNRCFCAGILPCANVKCSHSLLDIFPCYLLGEFLTKFANAFRRSNEHEVNDYLPVNCVKPWWNTDLFYFHGRFHYQWFIYIIKYYAADLFNGTSK